ncbi:MAG: methyltransferase [Pseudomonadota bacterium]
MLSSNQQPLPATEPPAAGSGMFTALRSWFLRKRAQLLADPRFHRFATRLPFARPVARQQARSLFDLCAGFVYTQVLRAFVELELPRLLSQGPRSLNSLSPQLGLSLDATQRLMVAAASLRLVSFLDARQERVVLGELGASLLANPGVVAMIHHHAVLYDDLSDPVALLRGEQDTTALQRYWDYGAAASDPSARPAADYSALMAASQQLIADEVLDAYRFGAHQHVLDIGGGTGAFLRAVGARHPDLALSLFDLPAVASEAQSANRQAGMADRIRVVPGSFITDPLPTGADLITLVRIVHDHDDAVVRQLLAAVHAALPPGGTLVVAEPMAETAGAEPMGGAYFGFYLLAMGQGRPRSAGELTQMLHDAGFRQVRPASTAIPLLTRVLVAKA